MSAAQTWNLVVLRRWPTRHELASIRSVASRRFVNDIHPTDADTLIASLDAPEPVTLYTLSTVIIDRFVPSGVDDLQRRLSVYRGKGAYAHRLTDDEAQMVFRALAAGVESLSEILLKRGIWR